MKTEQKVWRLIQKTGMFQGGDRVIAGVSGGADSVFLFELLAELAEKLPFQLEVIHVHHGLRGEEADRDANFVENLCRRRGIPCRVVRRRIREEAAARGMTLEEAGRYARHEVFREAAAGSYAGVISGEASAGIDICREKETAASQRVLIALAHHRSDLAETMLFRMARGTGIEGLAAIRPVSRLPESEALLVRPLLAVTRDEIEEALRERDISWCEDSTNAEEEAVRNRIRHRILPVLQEQVNSETVRHLAELAEEADDAADYLRAEAEKKAERYLRQNGTAAEKCPKQVGTAAGTVEISEELLQEHRIMQTMILKEALRRAVPGGSMQNISRVHLQDLLGLLQKEYGAHLDLPHGVCADRTEEGVVLSCPGAKEMRDEAVGKKPGEQKTPEKTMPEGAASCAAGSDNLPDQNRILLPVPKDGETIRIHAGEGVFTVRFAEPALKPIPQNLYTKWVDYGKMKGNIFIRTRREGDRLSVAEGKHKSLSDYFTNEKIPRAERDRILLVADENEVVWVVGKRLGYQYRISEETEKILEISFKKD
ncbi:MAG: tRNA lysidine(34) synthetase TilS [Lachnospiraceae bacterium]|nr:tRNA lysidine(34) synthetase TilS [Lachnospiraceae bacterium]